MNASSFEKRFRELFNVEVEVDGNFVASVDRSNSLNQQQTNEVFSDKWKNYSSSEEREGFYQFQRDWYLSLYGFSSESELKEHLSGCEVIFDAGCGLGYKAAWLAELAPHALVIGMDFSEAARQAAETYAGLSNLLFVQGDIADTGFHEGVIDYVNCDQVIMHTENPEATFAELVRITKNPKGEIACYFYAKKALPRELLDDHFRTACRQMSREELWKMSEQLTELGRRLSELNITIESPDIPALGIKGGKQDIQRFIYWNFLKCFWNEELGKETSIVTNYDWYSPSNARRFSEEEVHALAEKHGLNETYFHNEEACYSGRFTHS
jgi:SAM-dependent methyltransferase